jgi:hypothetical protein
MTGHRESDRPHPARRGPLRSKQPRKLSKSQRVAAWICGLAGVAAAAFITAFSTTLGNQVAALSTSQGAPGGQPVKIDLVNTQNSLGDAYVFPGSVVLTQQQLASLNSLDQSAPAYDRWFLSRGAVDTSPIDIQLVVQGNRTHGVRIVNIRPVISCQMPLHGTLFESPSAGGQGSTLLYLNLDQPRPALSYQAPGSGAYKDYFSHYTVSLNEGEQFTFQIFAMTIEHYCKFSLDMTVLDNGRTVVERVNNHGKPFQVTSIYRSSKYSVLYLGGLDSIYPKRQNNYGNTPWSRVNPATTKGE